MNERKLARFEGRDFRHSFFVEVEALLEPEVVPMGGVRKEETETRCSDRESV